jgi:hypothetical protein
VPIPFHCSGEFAIIPARWRWEFLLRNPDVRGALALLESVYRFGWAVFDRWGPARAGKASREAWLSFRMGAPGSLEYVAQQFLTLNYYIKPGRQDFDEHLGPTAYLLLIPGPADLECYHDLWRGFVDYGFPDLPLSRQAPGSETARAVELAAAELARKYHPVTTWAALGERGRREVRGALARLRKEFGLPSPRLRAEGYYGRLLGLWDAREGFDGERYVSRLRKTLRAAGATGEEYCRAFELVAGQRYDADSYRCLFAAECGDDKTSRRNAGRPRGKAGDKPARQAETPLADVPAVSHADPAEPVDSADANQFFLGAARQLLAGDGLTVQAAVSLAERAGLYEVAAQLLCDPDSMGALEQFLRDAGRTS